jgi:hypothetical protein
MNLSRRDFYIKVRPMDTQLFNLSPPRDDANRLQKVITAIKK